MDEAVLITAAKSGDENAQLRLYESHYERIFRLARRYAGSDQDAEDILQDVFVRAFNALPRFQNSVNGSFPAWLNRICVNCCLSHLRRRKHEAKLCTQSLNDLTQEPDSGEAPVESAVQVGQIRDMISRAVQILSPKQRIIFDLRFAQHLSVGEIAYLLDCSRSNVKTQLYRASEKLKKHLAPIWEE